METKIRRCDGCGKLFPKPMTDRQWEVALRNHLMSRRHIMPHPVLVKR